MDTYLVSNSIPPNIYLMPKSLKQLNDHDLLVTAFAAMKTNQYASAIKHFKEALRRDPGDPFAYNEIATCYFSIDDPENAQSNVKKAFRFAKRDPDLLILVAKTCQIIRNYSLAIQVLKEAENYPKLNHVALVRQAEIHELSNQLEDAESALEKLGGVSTQASRAIQAKLLKRRGKHSQAKEIIESLINDLGQDASAFKSTLQYELAGILDKLGDYKGSASMLKNAKSFHMGTDDYKMAERGRGGVIQVLSGLCEDLKHETLVRWKQEAEASSSNSLNSKKHTFLLGHPRSGTTLIEQVLDAHPDVTSADETSVFHNTIWMPALLKSSDKKINLVKHLDELTGNSIRKGRRDYQRHWEQSISSKKLSLSTHLLDKNPALTTRLAVIARFFPDASLIFALRDPRDVVISSYMQPVGINDWSINWLTVKDAVDYYCFIMQMWLDIRDKLTNPWIEVRYEDCVADFSSQAKRATSELDLTWHIDQENIQNHVKSKIVYSPTYADVGQAVYSSSIGRWKNYSNLLEPYLEKLEPYIKAFGYSEEN